MSKPIFQTLLTISLILILGRELFAQSKCEKALLDPVVATVNFNDAVDKLINLELSFKSDLEFQNNPIYREQLLNKFKEEFRKFKDLRGAQFDEFYVKRRIELLSESKIFSVEDKKISNREKKNRDQIEKNIEKLELTISPPIYKFENSKKLFSNNNSSDVWHTKAAALIDNEHLLFRLDNKLMDYDIKKETGNLMTSGRQQLLLPDQKRLAILDYKDDKRFVYEVYDIGTQINLKHLDLNIGAFIRRGDGDDFNRFAVSQDESLIALGGPLATILVVDLKTGEIIADDKLSDGIGSRVADIYFSDQDHIAYSGDYGIVSLNFRTGERITAQKGKGLSSGSIFSFSISSDKKHLFVAKYNNFFVLDASTLEVFQNSVAYGGTAKQTAFSSFIPNDIGNHILILSGDKESYSIYDPMSLKPIFNFENKYDKSKVREIIFSPDKSKGYVIHGNTKTELYLDTWVHFLSP